jgi:hypothetical protein
MKAALERQGRPVVEVLATVEHDKQRGNDIQCEHGAEPSE